MTRKQVIVDCPVSTSTSFQFSFYGNILFYDEVLQSIYQKLGNINSSDFSIMHNGKILTNDLIIQDDFSIVHLKIHFKLKGGKGGYGSLLRNAAKIKIKINDQSSNRNLNGRRIRDTENEKALINWLKKKRKENQIIKKLKDKATIIDNQKVVVSAPVLEKLPSEYAEKLKKWDTDTMRKSIADGLKLTKKVKIDDPYLQENTNDQNQPSIPIIREEKPHISEMTQFIGQHEKVQSFEESKDHQQIKQDNLPAQQQLTFSPIDLNKIKNAQELIDLGGDHLKYELNRLGLKCGGTTEQRANRLWEIICDPKKLDDPKFHAPQKKGSKLN